MTQKLSLLRLIIMEKFHREGHEFDIMIIW
jgi:hypothetical protein